MPTRSDWMTLSDAVLLSQCEVDTYRASGPGGQKRNKTSSAVRLRHSLSGLMAMSEESRSQHENKAFALRRLRATFALELREPVNWTDELPELLRRYREPSGRIRVSKANDDFWPVMAIVLDVFELHGGRMSEAAAQLQMSTGQLATTLSQQDKLFAAANDARRRFGHGPIRTKSD